MPSNSSSNTPGNTTCNTTSCTTRPGPECRVPSACWPWAGRVLSVLVATFAFATAVPQGAAAQTFSNPTPLAIPFPLGGSTASVYPSPIVVSGGPTSIGYLSVTLHGLSHTSVDQLDVLLVSPSDQRILLMSDAHGSGDANNNTITFIPDGIARLAQATSNVISGIYAPTAFAQPVVFHPPAPQGPYGTSMVPLIGTNANGTWNLYIRDTFPLTDTGSLAGGWSISFSATPPAPMGSAFTYQGVLSANHVPLNGDANIRFTLCNSQDGPTAAVAQALPLTRSLSGIVDGLVTTSLDFGPNIDVNAARWLNIEVESPPGSGFVELSPRQAITPVPQARIAQRAMQADLATNATNAANAVNANTAVSASLAASVPWSGITDVPSNVTSRWATGAGSSINYTAGPVGIGTSTPASRLHVADAEAVMATFESSNTIGTWFNVRNTSPGGVFWRMISTGSGNGEGAGRLLLGHGNVAGAQTSVMTLVSATGHVGIGTTNPTQRLTVAGNVLANNVAVPSSGRFKHNVTPMSDALERLMQLEGVTFDWNAEYAKDRPGREHDIGFVAEDVARIFPEVVFYDADGQVTGMDYSRLTAVAVAAIKQQQSKFDAELAKRDADLAELKARLQALEAAFSKPTPTTR